MVLVLAGCGSGTKTVIEREAAAPATTPTTTSTPPAPKAASAGLNNPAQQPDSSVAAYCNEVPIGHPCRASTAAPEDPNESPQRNCDTNIVANSHTSCDLAENVFYEVYKSGNVTKKSFSVMAYSSATHQNYEVGCGHSGNLIGCVSSPTSNYIFVDFPEAAVLQYTEAEATAYAASGKVGNPPPPAASSATGGGGEPEAPGGGQSASESGESDEVGSYSHGTDEAFCNEHECIGDFQGEDGYVVECSDGSYSHSGGKSGACSDHGGILRR